MRKPCLRPGDEAPLEELGDYWQGTDGLLRRATAHIYRRIIALECEGGFREWMDAHCLIFEGSSKNEEQKPEFFTLYKEFEARVSEALEEFVTSQFDDDGTRLFSNEMRAVKFLRAQYLEKKHGFRGLPRARNPVGESSQLR